jgi:hypothetical protein
MEDPPDAEMDELPEDGQQEAMEGLLFGSDDDDSEDEALPPVPNGGAWMQVDDPRGAQAFYNNPERAQGPRRAGAPDFEEEEEEEGEGPQHQGRQQDQPARPPRRANSVKSLPGFNPAFLGDGIDPVHPIFNQGVQSHGGWVDWDAAQVDGMVPVRSWVYNIPLECIADEATRMTHWKTPLSNPARATAIAALLGTLVTGTSKGLLSGNHEEIARQEAAAEDGGGEDQRDGSRKKGPSRVYRYMSISNHDPALSVPMFVWAYEEIYNAARTEVRMIRIWKHVRAAIRTKERPSPPQAGAFVRRSSTTATPTPTSSGR